MGGEAKAKLVITNMMKSGIDLFFEDANTTFVEELTSASKTLNMH